ncbi:MAG: NADP-dependent malic enzyme [Magnetococcales bacterium]|nr:NADP-dependent malic enzyme [Magnetococcales bacterium]
MSTSLLDDVSTLFPEWFTPAQTARAKTIFYKEMALRCHHFYGGKMMTVPKAGIFSPNDVNIWYTPGVSKVSTTIRDNPLSSFYLTGRGNTVAVVSDSTRVLGDGDVTPPGGLGVMEGKALLMKVLGGLDAVPLCIDSRGPDGTPDPERIIQFVEMVQHSFAAINLEDISQPNCYRVLDVLRERCEIPVWHDDAQGTGSVALAGLINALKVAEKSLHDVRIVFIGAGAANTATARLVITAGGDPDRIVMFDSRGALSRNRSDIEENPAFYRKWELCQQTNPDAITDLETALKGADVLIAISRPGPDAIPPAWIQSMADKAILFALANPVPEIYPHAAHEAGALVVATGRGDFPNQANNSLGFPGILKGAILARARRISDGMAITAARSLAHFAEEKGISPERILPDMSDPMLFATEAADVAMQAVTEGLARHAMRREDYLALAREEIMESHALFQHLMDEKIIKPPPESLVQECLRLAISQV